jgi:hypothetical protein
MTESAKAAPPNSIVLIEDPRGGEVPTTITKGELIAATESCLAVGCQSFVDGETRFTLGRVPDVDPGTKPAFDGLLKTPTRQVAVRSVLGETILQASVAQDLTNIVVWVNHPTEPDEVVVGVR